LPCCNALPEVRPASGGGAGPHPVYGGWGDLYIGRKAFRDAVFPTKFEGISGVIACDPYGERSQFKPSVLEFVPADAKTFGIGTNPKKVRR
jgi:hypothetical protein